MHVYIYIYMHIYTRCSVNGIKGLGKVDKTTFLEHRLIKSKKTPSS